MKRVALISSFCDTEEKLNILSENIITLKNNGLDVILITPIFLPEKIIKKCDYVFYTKDNPILEWPIKVQLYGTFFRLNDGKFLVFNSYGSDYGWAGLNQIKKLTEIALTFDYDYFYNLIYDLDIDKNVIKILNQPEDFLVSGFQRNNQVHSLVSLHFMVFNKQNAKNILNFFSLENYLNFLNSSNLVSGKVAEGFFQNLKNDLNYKIADFLVADKIQIREEFFNHSNIDGVKFFLEKRSDNALSDIKICVFENKNKINIDLIVNEKKINISEELKIFSFNVCFLDLRSIYVKTKDQIMDLMPILKKINYSFIEIKSEI